MLSRAVRYRWCHESACYVRCHSAHGLLCVINSFSEAHKPGRPAAQGFDYSEAISKLAADHRGIQHRYLRESATGTRIAVPARARSGGKLDLPPPGALP